MTSTAPRAEVDWSAVACVSFPCCFSTNRTKLKKILLSFSLPTPVAFRNGFSLDFFSKPHLSLIDSNVVKKNEITVPTVLSNLTNLSSDDETNNGSKIFAARLVVSFVCSFVFTQINRSVGRSRLYFNN